MLADPLRQVLAAYWRWKRPADWLFPGAKPGCPISRETVFERFLANGESVRLKNFGIFRTAPQRTRDKKKPNHIRVIKFKASNVLSS
jgi:hypothetical protein